MSKAEKIKAEIERLKNELSDNKERLSLGEIITVNNCYNNLIFFINSLEDTEKDFSIKESVIPFGASDSELMEATYFIPQGYHAVIDGNKVIIKKCEDSVSNDLDSFAKEYSFNIPSDIYNLLPKGKQSSWILEIENAVKTGAQWQKANLWKDAQGDDLPKIDREVIVLVKTLPEHEDSLLKVAFAHRPPKYWEGKSIGTGEITRYEPMRYDKGQWSMPAVVWWLDVELPKEEE